MKGREPAAPARSRPGARGRIGLIQPAPGVMIEHEWPPFLPADILFPVARVRLTSATAEGYDGVAAQAPAAAADLASAGADLVAFACTVGSLYAGVAAESALIGHLEHASGKPAFSLAATCMQALRRLGARRLAILTPYSEEANALVADYAIAQGFEISGTVATPVGIATVGEIGSPEMTALCVAALAGLPDADALWLPCTAMRTIEAIPFVEAVGGRPVVSGSQALLWRGLAMIDETAARPAGRLFDCDPKEI